MVLKGSRSFDREFFLFKCLEYRFYVLHLSKLTVMLKVTIGESKPQEKPFPKLMKEKGTENIFFFYRSCIGLPLNQSDRYETDDNNVFGTWASGWYMDRFEDFNEPITIQNA